MPNALIERFFNFFKKRRNDKLVLSSEQLNELRTTARLHYMEGDYREAVAIFEKLMTHGENNEEDALYFIHSLVLAGDHQRAYILTKKLSANISYADKIFGDESHYCITHPSIFTVFPDLHESTDHKTSEEHQAVSVSKSIPPDSRLVFVYWSGYVFKLIRILKHLIFGHSVSGRGYEVHWLNPENIRTYIDIPDFFNELSLAHQADYIRVQVIYKYGGIWLDADTLVMSSLDPLFDVIEREGAFFIEGKLGVTINAVFGARSGYPLMNVWKSEMEKILQSKGKNIGYTEIGNHLIDRILKREDMAETPHIFSGSETMYPVFWNESVEKFLEAPYEYASEIRRSFQPVLVLVQAIYRALETKTLSEILTSRMPLNDFIHRAYEALKLIDLDFIEIGTSSFNTIVETIGDDQSGLCVEPIEAYLSALPSRPKVNKVNCAITSQRKRSFLDIYYLPPEYIAENDLPRWFKGCNSVDQMHPLHIKYGHAPAVVKKSVPVMNIEELLVKYRVGHVGHLKIDTEGHDLIIMDGFLTWMESLPSKYYPSKITFESNELYTALEINSMITRVQLFGYIVTETGWNTTMILESYDSQDARS